jgi:hypothetical protein
VKVHRRTTAQASIVDPPFAQAHMSNHKPMRTEYPLMAAAL